MNSKAGITLIEILLVIAIVAILAASAAPFLSSFVLRNNHDIARDRLLGSLRKAQSYSMTKKNGAIWGVCLPDSTTIRLYRGSCNSPAFAQDYTFNSNVTVSGFSDVTFSKHRGEPSTTVNALITSSQSSNTVTVNAAGRIAIQ